MAGSERHGLQTRTKTLQAFACRIFFREEIVLPLHPAHLLIHFGQTATVFFEVVAALDYFMRHSFLGGHGVSAAGCLVERVVSPCRSSRVRRGLLGHSGLSDTEPIGLQFRVRPDQCAGFRARAA
jgi:hypothetical protein